MKELDCDLLIIGSGAAGSYAALQAAKQQARVVLVTKSSLLSGSTRWAQGGVAFPRDTFDVESHLSDTLRAGRGLVDKEVSSMILGDALSLLEDLTDLGMSFDESPALEGGHSKARVRSVRGDESGYHLLSFLHSKLNPNIIILENHFVSQLLRDGHRVTGAMAWPNGDPLQEITVTSRSTLIATGGLGQVYETTTNPRESTGDGIALAYRIGASLRDLELVQFHPTVLPNGALISEACRGEGAHLVDSNGCRFMEKYDPAGDLAPRDVVARAIHLEELSSGQVFLDLRPIENLKAKFPTVYASVAKLGFDPALTPVPVRPAAHYLMGGISTDENGVSSVEGLFAAGEVASTGFHGANRLASNSLLESLIVGARAATHALEVPAIPPGKALHDCAPVTEIDPQDVPKIRRIMARAASVLREESTLEQGYQALAEIPARHALSAQGAEAQNMRLVSMLIIKGALARRESRGSHFRSDFPSPLDNAQHIQSRIDDSKAITEAIS